MSDAGTLHIGDGADWHFVNGDWVDGEDGLLSVPEEIIRSEGYNMQGFHWAFHRKLCYQDCTVRFEVSLEPHTDAGIILRARDESHFYLLHFPNCGQACRAQHFWVALSKMDDSGYLKCVKMEMVRRVPSTTKLWLPAEVTFVGRRILVRVGDYGYFEAEDDTYPGPGHLGVYLVFRAGVAQIRNLVVEGAPGSVSPWREDVRQPTNWFHPLPTAESVWQQPVDLKRFPDGGLLLLYNLQLEKRADEEAQAAPHLVRSADGGRTWSDPEPFPLVDSEKSWTPPRMHLTPAGRLIAMFKAEPGWLASESPDRGHTWSEPVPTNLPTSRPHLHGFGVSPQGFLNLDDGSMLLLMLGGHELKDPSHNIWTWGSAHCQAFSCRSEDDGRTWSEPVNMDTPGFDAEGNQYEGNLDLTEPSAVQLANGRIMAFIRPIYSPWMWETWSDDGGVTWGPCVRGPFPGYAAPNMVRTASGALLIAHRLPWLTVHCSLDGGRTWQGTIIDNGGWSMGSMCEVEPDVVLHCYWDAYESLMRVQLIQVTPSGIEPVRVR